ncbi:MAG TPA: hypothetical protein VN695_12025 [Streptosporangiaceae bacterium]|nr:hypothetical protein [Streptosporangiaceae bacterium]
MTPNRDGRFAGRVEFWMRLDLPFLRAWGGPMPFTEPDRFRIGKLFRSAMPGPAVRIAGSLERSRRVCDVVAMGAGSVVLGFVIDDEVVFSLGRRFRAPWLRRLIISLLITACLLLPGRRLLGAAILMAQVTAVAAAIYLWQGRFRTILTVHGIKVRGYFNHFVPWTDVAGFDVVKYGAPRPMAEEGILAPRSGSYPRVNRRLASGGKLARLATVAVVRVNGRRVQLRAPWVTSWQFDPDFDDKVTTMQRWWREYSVPQRPLG